MRLVLIVSALVSLLQLGVSPQSRPASQPKTPAHATEIEVKGCMTGSMLTDVKSGRSYHLTGDKSTMRLLTREHKGHMEVVTGNLETERRMGGRKEKQVGDKTTIFVGAAASHSTGQEDPVPELKVKTIEHVADNCGPR